MTTRRLAAILAADVVGFSALMGQDEEGTLDRIKQLRREVVEPKVREHHGRVFKTTGDGLLVEFASPVEAVRCTAAVQEVPNPKSLRSLPGGLARPESEDVMRASATQPTSGVKYHCIDSFRHRGPVGPLLPLRRTPMPIFLDRHDMKGVTAEQVAEDHRKDLTIQGQYGVKFLTYWFDEERGTTFCLIDAPDTDTAQQVHRVAHGHVAGEIIEVALSAVEAFLGRITDPKHEQRL